MNKFIQKVFSILLFLAHFFSLNVSCDSKFNRKKVVGMQLFKVTGHLLNAYHCVPDKITREGIVITIGGGEGGSGVDFAIPLAGMGYEVLSVYYFGQENLPLTCTEVPLEFFGEVLKYIKAKCKGKKPITIMGGSKGAELAAVLVSYYPEIDNIVLSAPASYVYQGYNSKNKSSWTWKGEPLPFIPFPTGLQRKSEFKYDSTLGIYYSVWRPFFEEAVKIASEETREKSRIDLSNFKGQCLILAGGDDCIYQADTAAKELQAQNPEKIKIHIFEKAGHSFDFVYVQDRKHGGTPEGNYKAMIESKKILYKFLTERHPKK